MSITWALPGNSRKMDRPKERWMSYDWYWSSNPNHNEAYERYGSLRADDQLGDRKTL